jgi:hypothetical protein
MYSPLFFVCVPRYYTILYYTILSFTILYIDTIYIHMHHFSCVFSSNTMTPCVCACEPEANRSEANVAQMDLGPITETRGAGSE